MSNNHCGQLKRLFCSKTFFDKCIVEIFCCFSNRFTYISANYQLNIYLFMFFYMFHEKLVLEKGIEPLKFWFWPKNVCQLHHPSICPVIKLAHGTRSLICRHKAKIRDLFAEGLLPRGSTRPATLHHHIFTQNTKNWAGKLNAHPGRQ